MQRGLNPRLVGIGGPVEGGVFGLADGDLSIGRDASNQLLIDDPSIAACHCRIRRQTGDEFAIQDFGSCGATIVNGLPVTERVLQHGDEIRMGDCRFLFLLWDVDAQFGVGLKVARSCDQSGRQDCPYRMTATSMEEAAANSRTWCSLTTILKIGASIQLARGAEEIAKQLLEGIFEAVPAQHGGILLFDGQGQEPAFASYRDRETGPTVTARTYRTIVDQAWRGVTAILANDVLPDRPPAAAGDVTEPQPRSVLAAPIITSARTLGVIYFDSCIPVRLFMRTIWSWRVPSAPSWAWPSKTRDAWNGWKRRT